MGVLHAQLQNVFVAIFLKVSDIFTSLVTHSSYKIKQYINCTSTHIVYLAIYNTETPV